MAVNGRQNGTSSLPEVTYGFIGETYLGEHLFFEAQLIWPPARHRSDGLPYGTQSTS
jgi:hypothetical protein